MNLIDRLPDPHKNPTGFVKQLKAIQGTYRATAQDLEQLLKYGYEGQTRQLLTVVSNLDKSNTEESGLEFVRKVEEEWLKARESKSWTIAAEMEHQYLFGTN